jgi:hypothetical protein
VPSANAPVSGGSATAWFVTPGIFRGRCRIFRSAEKIACTGAGRSPSIIKPCGRAANSVDAIAVRPLLKFDVMTDSPPTAASLLLIQAEYRELPGLKLTMTQAERLWALDEHTCEALLEALIAARFLRKTAADAYVRADQQ